MKTEAIELFSYKPADGIALEDVLVMDARVKKKFVIKQPGYISRFTTLAEDGTVSVFVHWASMADIEASQAKAMKDVLMGEYIGMMNPDSLVFSNLSVRQ